MSAVTVPAHALTPLSDLPSPPPPFSDRELARRRETLLALADEAGCSQVLVYGANRAGTGVAWLSRWPVTREAALLVAEGEVDQLRVQFHNHVPLARQLAAHVEVGWGGASTIATVAELLRRRGGRLVRLGVVGPLPFAARDELADAVGEIVDLNPGYLRARLVKSDEEIAHLRHGAALSDAALAALATGLAPGSDDHHLLDRIERAYVPAGGTTHIHYLGITDMADPDRCVPAQYPIGATVATGSVVVTELSAAFRGYAGQVLRTFTVGAPPTARYAELHEVASAAFQAVLDVLRDGTTPAEVVAAAGLIHDAGYRLCDDLLHGFGGGYLPPVIGRLDDPLPDVVLRDGMTVVVQPNVISPDERAGVQTGELVRITADGVERLHRAPEGLIEVPVEADAASNVSAGR